MVLAGQHTTVPSVVTSGIQAANPTMPQNFVATPGDGQIALNWAAPSSLGGTALVSYLVQISTDNTNFNTVSRSNPMATSETIAGLSNNTPYYVRVRAMTRNSGAWAHSASTVVPYGLPINTELPAISGAAEYEATLLAGSGSWNENGRSAILSYQWQAEVNGSWVNIPDATNSSYQVGLYVGSAIRAQVTSTNLAGATTVTSSATSAVVAQPAAAPTSLSATLADHSIQLSWAAPNYIGGSTIIDYRVQIRSSGGSWTTVSRTASTATSQTITGLVNGTSYEVQVQALTTVDGNLTTLGSLVPRATPINTALPAVSLQSGASAPQYDFAVSTDLGSWNSNGANLSSLTIQWQVKLGGTWTNIPGATGASYTVADYVGSQLRAAVTASNVAGSTVAYSAATAAVVANPAAAPTDVSLVPGDQSIVVNWTEPNYLGGDVIVDYLVETSTGGSWTAFSHSASTATTQTVTGLNNGDTVQVRVSAVTSVNGLASASVSSVPRSNPISTSLPTLSWQAPVGSVTAAPQVGRTVSASNGAWNANGAAISSYGYQWQLNTGSGWNSISGETGPTYVVSGNVGGQLRVIVTASNVAGGTAATSAASPVIISGPATPPRNLQVAEVDHGLQLSWQAPLISGGAAITDYEVEYTTDGNTWVPLSHTASNATAQSITSLSNAVETTVRVRALNGVDGEWVIADPATPRGLPISQTAPGVTGSALFGATLTAGPGVWNSNGADIDSFTFQWQSSRDGVVWSAVPGATGSSYRVGLYVGSKLRVQVTATNEAGSTISSSLPTAVISAIPASTPELTSQSVGNAQITLGWTPPIHSGGVALTGYTLDYSTDQNTWTSLSYGADVTSATITGLRNGTSYYARVRAETDRAGDWSSVAGPFAPVAPPVVTTPSATANYDFLRQLVMPVAPTGTVLTSLTGPSTVTVLSDGRIELTPTQSLALRDGQPVTASVELNSSGLSVQTGTVSIGLNFATVTQTEASASGTSVLQQGQTAQLTGTGFAEGTPVVGWIQSDPIKIGEAMVFGGAVSGEFTIPSDIEPGQHTIQVNGIDTQGAVVSIIYGVEVQETPDVVETVGAGALAEPGSLTANWIWWLGAIFLLLIILTAVILIRRRQQSN